MNKHLARNISILFCAVILSASSAMAAVTFDWAVIGNAGNAADNTGYGKVDYEYSIAKTEVTNAQYIEFLNAVAKTDTYGVYNSGMSSMGITQNGTSGNYSYTLQNNDENWANRPVVHVSWYDTLRFANWLNNGQLSGAQDATTTEYGAYDMSQGASVVRLAGANYWLPSENEWYKAAYYDPSSGVYYDYATGTDTTPNNNTPANDTGNSANYYSGDYTLGSPYYSTEVGAYDESKSPYGTYDQTGNVYEWDETLIGEYRGARGGSWYHDENWLVASYRGPGGTLTLRPQHSRIPCCKF